MLRRGGRDQEECEKCESHGVVVQSVRRDGGRGTGDGGRGTGDGGRGTGDGGRGTGDGGRGTGPWKSSGQLGLVPLAVAVGAVHFSVLGPRSSVLGPRSSVLGPRSSPHAPLAAGRQRPQTPQFDAGLRRQRRAGEAVEQEVVALGGRARVAQVRLVGAGLEPERAVEKERRRVELLEPVEHGDGVLGPAVGEQRRGAEVQRLVAERVDAAGRRVERVEDGDRLPGQTAPVRECRPGVDPQRLPGHVDLGVEDGLRRQRLVERHPERDRVVRRVGRRVLVLGLGARERRVHEPLVEVQQRQLVAGLLRERADPDRLVDVLEPLPGRVEIAPSERDVTEGQSGARRDARVPAAGGGAQPGLRLVEVAENVAEQVRQRERGGGDGGAGGVGLDVAGVRLARRVGVGRRAGLGALAVGPSGLVPQPRPGQQGVGGVGAVGVALQDLVERARRRLGRPGGVGLAREGEQRLAPLALQPVEGADGVERRVVVAELEPQPRLELADAPVQRVERGGPSDGRRENVGRALARE